jgi:quinol monooxygenase YgiN
MYGTIARFKVKPDRVRDFYALGKEWDEFHRKRAVGYISTELLWEDKEAGRLCMVVHFTSKEQYFKNAASPEQHEFYLRFRQCMDAEPEWIDGYIDRWDSLYSHPPTFLVEGQAPRESPSAAVSGTKGA